MNSNTLTPTSASAELYPLAAPLPVELVSFMAERRATAMHLSWQSTAAQGTTCFEVERSADGQAFECIGSVVA